MRVLRIISLETVRCIFEPFDLLRFDPVVAVIFLVVRRIAVSVEEEHGESSMVPCV